MSTAQQLVERCTALGVKLSVAESCTGGLIAAAITEVAGASTVFEYGFVTYANTAKTDMIGVPEALLAAHGAVSASVAEAMANGARVRAKADMAVAVTGIAGPGGGTEKKPVGLVFIALAARSHTHVEEHHFSGTRAEIRAASAQRALALLYDTACQWRPSGA